MGITVAISNNLTFLGNALACCESDKDIDSKAMKEAPIFSSNSQQENK